MNLKKTFLVIFTSFLTFAFARDFVPTLHSTPSVRQQGFGGFYTTDINNFYGLYANPAMLGARKKHSLYPSIFVNVAGPIEQSRDIAEIFISGDSDRITKMVSDLDGLHFGAKVAPLLSFGHVSPMGFGWAFDTQAFVDAAIPGVMLSDITGGLEMTLRAGFGFPIINFDNHQLLVGGTAKVFSQYAVNYSGNLLNIIDSLESIPSYLTVGYGFDFGAMYTLCNKFDIAVVWNDALTFAHVAPGIINSPGKKFNDAKMLPSKLAAGVAYRFPVEWSNGIISSFSIYADYRNIFAFFDNKARNRILEFAAGTELVLGNIFSLRFGVSEMYPAVGFGLAFGAFKVDFSLYGRELGFEPGNIPCMNAGLFLGFTY